LRGNNARNGSIPATILTRRLNFFLRDRFKTNQCILSTRHLSGLIQRISYHILECQEYPVTLHLFRWCTVSELLHLLPEIFPVYLPLQFLLRSG
ncbi:TPA: hypothetical protein ACHKJM_005028, partial [Escherichia coli]